MDWLVTDACCYECIQVSNACTAHGYSGPSNARLCRCGSLCASQGQNDSSLHQTVDTHIISESRDEASEQKASSQTDETLLMGQVVVDSQ